MLMGKKSAGLSVLKGMNCSGLVEPLPAGARGTRGEASAHGILNRGPALDLALMGRQMLSLPVPPTCVGPDEACAVVCPACQRFVHVGPAAAVATLSNPSWHQVACGSQPLISHAITVPRPKHPPEVVALVGQQRAQVRRAGRERRRRPGGGGRAWGARGRGWGRRGRGDDEEVRRGAVATDKHLPRDAIGVDGCVVELQAVQAVDEDRGLRRGLAASVVLLTRCCWHLQRAPSHSPHLLVLELVAQDAVAAAGHLGHAAPQASRLVLEDDLRPAPAAGVSDGSRARAPAC